MLEALVGFVSGLAAGREQDYMAQHIQDEDVGRHWCLPDALWQLP